MELTPSDARATTDLNDEYVLNYHAGCPTMSPWLYF